MINNWLKVITNLCSFETRATHRRCRPTDDDTALASAASDPNSGLSLKQHVIKILSHLSPKKLEVKTLTDETDSSAQNEKPVQYSDINVLLSFFSGEASAISEEIHDREGNDSIDIQNEVWFLLNKGQISL